MFVYLLLCSILRGLVFVYLPFRLACGAFACLARDYIFRLRGMSLKFLGCCFVIRHIGVWLFYNIVPFTFFTIAVALVFLLIL